MEFDRTCRYWICMHNVPKLLHVVSKFQWRIQDFSGGGELAPTPWKRRKLDKEGARKIFYYVDPQLDLNASHW